MLFRFFMIKTLVLQKSSKVIIDHRIFLEFLQNGEISSRVHTDVCARSIMYSCTILEFHLLSLFGKNCTSVRVISGWLIEKKIFYSSKVSIFGRHQFFIYIARLRCKKNANLPRLYIIVLY